MQRANSEYMDGILGHKFDVLDKGYIIPTEYLGTEETIVKSARVSYGDGTKQSNDDAGLINYLVRNYHTSPIEQCSLQVEVKLPLFVHAQWVRHRTAKLNVMSARYSVMPDEFYIPSREQVRDQSQTNKQGGGEKISVLEANGFIDVLKSLCKKAYKDYRQALNNKNDTLYQPSFQGIARETARMGLPQNLYTKMVWQIDAHNLMHFLRLRADSHAQWEIRQYANVLCEILKGWMPNLYQAFEDYRLNALTLSAKDLKVLYESTSIPFNFDEAAKRAGMSAGEKREHLEKMKVLYDDL